MNRSPSIFAIITFVVANAHAATLQLTLDGNPVAGGEVCWFAAGALDDPVARFTSFTDITCSSADRDVNLPRIGVYNVFARQQKGFVSRDVLLLRDGRLDGGNSIDLVPAQRVALDRPQQRMAVYVESTGNVVPLVPGDKDVLVPRDASVVPFVIGDPNLVAVGVVPDPAAGPWKLRPRGAPTVELAHRKSINGLDPLLARRPAIAFFRDAPNGKARVSGKQWTEDEVAVEHGRAGRTLRTAPVSVVTVRWSVPADLAAYAPTRSSCASAPPHASADPPAITILRCGSIGAAGCPTVRTIPLDRTATSGEIAVRGLESGSYVLQLGYRDLPPAFAKLQFDGVDSVVGLAAAPDRFFGRVTRDGKPYHAFVAIGDGAVSDPNTGEYVTFGTPPPKPEPSAERRFFKDPNPIEVRGCDPAETVFYVPDAAPVPNSRFDIDITPTTVHLSVVDASSGAAIEGAAVSYRVSRRDDVDATLFEGSPANTDANGKTDVPNLPQHRRIVFCATKEQYEHSCAQPVTLDSPASDVTVGLTRGGDHHGTVSSAAAGGRVVWITPTGETSESATIATDGTFTYARAHEPGELVCVVSAGAPLLVLRYPSLQPDATFDISYAGIAVRDFHAVLPPSAHEPKGFLDISIGDAVVPLGLFAEHLRYRGSRPVYLGPATIEVPQIAVTARVNFLFAPLTWAEANSGGRGVDFFYLPAARALPRVVPDSRGVAVVGE